jgi:hypothetical protein
MRQDTPSLHVLWDRSGGEGGGISYEQILQALLRLTSYRPRLNRGRGDLVKLQAQASLYRRDDILEDLSFTLDVLALCSIF